MKTENVRDGKAIDIPSVYTLSSEGKGILQRLQFIPMEKEAEGIHGRKIWVEEFWGLNEKYSPEQGFCDRVCAPKGRRVVISSGEPENVTVVAIVNVFWPMAGAHIKAKIPDQTFAEAVLRFDDGRVALATTSWGNLTPSQQEKVLKNLPVCPKCGKVRFDATRGVNACGKCLTLDDHSRAVESFFKKLDPTVVVSPSKTQESLLFRFGDEKVSHRFRNGYGFTWIEDEKALKAGKGKMQKAWDVLRPIPSEAIAEASAILSLFGITLQVNPSEPREVFVQGEWIESLKPASRKGLGLKGKKNAYFVHGVQALNRFVELMLGALRGDKCPDDVRFVVEERYYQVPEKPRSNWENNWWTL